MEYYDTPWAKNKLPDPEKIPLNKLVWGQVIGNVEGFANQRRIPLVRTPEGKFVGAQYLIEMAM